MAPVPLLKHAALPLPGLTVVAPAPPADPARHARDLAHHLRREGVIAAHDMGAALAILAAPEDDPSARLMALGIARDPALTQAIARFARLQSVSPQILPPDPALIDQLGPDRCLRLGLLPWRQADGVTTILAALPQHAEPHRPLMEDTFGPIRIALAPRAEIDAALQAARGQALCETAETLTPAAESCRSLPSPTRAMALALLALAAATLLAPSALVLLLTGLALTALILSMLLKTAALLAALRYRAAPLQDDPADWPTVSVIVALYHEAELAQRLVRRLARLDYPRDRLDVILVVEQDDEPTRSALLSRHLPPWLRVITVPQGRVRTKPRALNYALGFCRGSIVGVYDAEDAPDPAQLRAVARRFHHAGPKVACLQGVLDFYNPRTNWLARAFTLEFAVWFRLILPGLDRLGLPLPLGGTTLFFRRAALDALGGWDAHNVTEDADLGLRLYRHGYRTELLPTVTEEEANCRVLPWIRQRSRWIKGYMMTWRVHMRRPRLLWQQVGPRAFLAVQVLFLCSLLQVILAPLLLSLWLISLGLPHPVSDALPPWVFLPLMGISLGSEALNLTLCLMARRQSPHRIPLVWALLPHLLQPLAAIAAYKALWELLRRPFYWDKTQHGRVT